MKINVGSGRHKLDGYVNCDLDPSADVVCDCAAALPFPDGSADELASYHFIEHLWRWQADDVFRDWFRILRPGGTLIAELPCLEKMMVIYQVYKQHNLLPERTLFLHGLYGDPSHKLESMMHKWGWHSSELKEAFEKAGFQSVRIMPPTTHNKHRDMRLEAKRP